MRGKSLRQGSALDRVGVSLEGLVEESNFEKSS
jgi:hypothetical protein